MKYGSADEMRARVGSMSADEEEEKMESADEEKAEGDSGEAAESASSDNNFNITRPYRSGVTDKEDHASAPSAVPSASRPEGGRTAILSSSSGKGLPPPPTGKPLAASAMSSSQDTPGKNGSQDPTGHGLPTGNPIGGGFPDGALSDEDMIRGIAKNVAQSIGRGERNIR